MTTVFDVPADLKKSQKNLKITKKSIPLHGPILLKPVFTKKENLKTKIGGILELLLLSEEFTWMVL